MSGRSSEPRPFAVLPGGLAPLGYRNFALFWVGHFSSNTGRWVMLIGSVWIVYELTRSPVLLGLLGIVRAIPSILLSPIAGVIADRVDQRRLLYFTQSLALVSSFALGLLVLADLVEVWHVYLQVAFQAAIQAFDASTRHALFPRLVPRHELPEAVTLSATAARSAELIGPVIGGFAIAGLSVAAPFMINAAMYLALMGAIALMRDVAPRSQDAGSSFRGDLTEGLRHIVRSELMSGLLRLEIVFSLFQMNEVMITIVGRESLKVGPEGLGFLLAAPASGAILGILGMVAFGQRRHQGRFVIGCTFAYCVGLVAFAIAPSYPFAFASLAVVGFFDVLVTVTRHSIMQLASPPRMRGRVMANMGTITRGFGPMAQTQSGFLAGAFGPPIAVLAAAAVVGGAALATLPNRSLWAFSRDDQAPDATDATDAALPGAESARPAIDPDGAP